LFFKISGKENYVDGVEAEQFFSTIAFKETSSGSVNYQPAYGDFSVKFPQQPVTYLNTSGADMNNRWEYEAVDEQTGDAFLIFKKSVHNFRFLDEDNFELGLMEESFRNPARFEKQISREQKKFKGYPALDVKEKLKDGSIVYARYIIRGPHYYVIAAKTKNKKADFSYYFNSFNFLPFRYNPAAVYADTFMHFTVNTPVAPQINNEIRHLTENLSNGNKTGGYFNYWPRAKNGTFISKLTGEMIGVSIQEYPAYFYAKDSAKFLADEMKPYFENSRLLHYKTDTLNLKNNVNGFRFNFRDTGSSRYFNKMLLLKDNYTFSLFSMGDTLSEESTFIKTFFSSFAPEEKKLGRSINENRLDVFFADLFSEDSATQKKAQQSLSNIYFGEKGVPKITAAINRLNLKDKEYFNTKVKLISELGYIKDTSNPVIVSLLKKIFENTADTGVFQNEVFKALARHKTKNACGLFKELILQDPPVFSDNYDYSSMFRNLGDSLLLARGLFPELLQLSTLTNYKDHVLSLLVKLADSNLVKGADYENYFTKIYFDAKVELKMLQIKDEKILEKELLKDDEDNKNTFAPTYSRYSKSELDDYSVLLLPFYREKKSVQLFFERLLQSREPEVRLMAAVLLLRSKIPVADSILTNLAAVDRYRSKLYTKLEKAKLLDKFPDIHCGQLEMARSFMLADKNYIKVDSIIFIKKQPTAYLNKKGVVYFFKYRVNKEDDWKIGISGLQPEDGKQIFTESKLTSMTGKKIKNDEPLDEQLQNQLKKILFSFHPSARQFYGNNNVSGLRTVNTYED
jgi:hypothetical protein